MYAATCVSKPDNPGMQHETLQGETVLCSVSDMLYAEIQTFRESYANVFSL